MTRAELIAELRRRIAEANAQEKGLPAATDVIVPSWATFFNGYREALERMIEWLEGQE
jgi:hypothetical protein